MTKLNNGKERTNLTTKEVAEFFEKVPVTFKDRCDAKEEVHRSRKIPTKEEAAELFERNKLRNFTASTNLEFGKPTTENYPITNFPKSLFPHEIEYFSNEDGSGIGKHWLNRAVLETEVVTSDLLLLIKTLNKSYRAGRRIVSDADYDNIFIAELRYRDPTNPWLTTVEPEPPLGKTATLPILMLTTKKLYTRGEVEVWLDRIIKAGKAVGADIASIQIKITPKLDGYSSWSNKVQLITRGEDGIGTDLSHVLRRGLSIVAKDEFTSGPGEIVVDLAYFNNVLAPYYDNPRNFIASVIKQGELSDLVKTAIVNKAIVFVPFNALDFWIGTPYDLSLGFDDIINKIWHISPYEVDGVVLEAVDPAIKDRMGHNKAYHRWQAAFKKISNVSVVKVKDVIGQLGMTGRITPVILIEPTIISKVLVSRATAHNYGTIRKLSIGKDAIISVTRAGEVIPKLLDVVEATTAFIPTVCPSCKTELIWDNDFLICPNRMNCKGQKVAALYHFFNRIGNNEGFGKTTLSTLYDNEITTLPAIYHMTKDQLATMGYKAKTINNYLRELNRSRTTLVADYKFLSAFGIPGLGRTNSETLLKVFTIDQIFNLSIKDLEGLSKISPTTASNIIRGLYGKELLIKEMLALGFNLINSNDIPTTSATIAVCFTGIMLETRDMMTAQAKLKNIAVTDSLTTKSNYLVIGLKPSQKKIDLANKFGIPILTEREFLTTFINV